MLVGDQAATRANKYTHKHTHTCMHTHTHAYADIHIQKTHIHKHAHPQARTKTQTHIYTRTHMQEHSPHAVNYFIHNYLILLYASIVKSKLNNLKQKHIA